MAVEIFKCIAQLSNNLYLFARKPFFNLNFIFEYLYRQTGMRTKVAQSDR